MWKVEILAVPFGVVDTDGWFWSRDVKFEWDSDPLPIQYNHSLFDLPLGFAVVSRIDDVGVWMDGIIRDSAIGERELLEVASAVRADGSPEIGASIGFEVVANFVVRDDDTIQPTVVKLREITMTQWPAIPGARMRLVGQVADDGKTENVELADRATLKTLLEQ